MITCSFWIYFIVIFPPIKLVSFWTLTPSFISDFCQLPNELWKYGNYGNCFPHFILIWTLAKTLNPKILTQMRFRHFEQFADFRQISPISILGRGSKTPPIACNICQGHIELCYATKNNWVFSIHQNRIFVSIHSFPYLGILNCHCTRNIWLKFILWLNFPRKSMFKGNINTRKMCEMFSELTIKEPERGHFWTGRCLLG